MSYIKLLFMTTDVIDSSFARWTYESSTC